MPLVSVVIPTFNRPTLLAEAIRSILLQTFEDFELIVADDGSEAETRTLLSDLRDRRVRVLSLEHGERSQARNIGMAQARGKYIALMDDDDLSLPLRLEKQVEFLENHPDVALAGCGGQLVTESGVVFATIRPWEKKCEPTLTDCLMGCLFLPSGVLLRRDALEGIEPWFDPALRLAEDFDFWIRLAHAGRSLAWVPDVLIVYRMYEGRSAAVHIGYMMNCKRVLDAYYARPDVPPQARQVEGKAYAHCFLNGAFRAYAGGATPLGKRFLREALTHAPDLMKPPDSPHILSIFSAFLTRQLFSNWDTTIQTFFQNLPDEMLPLNAFRDSFANPAQDPENTPSLPNAIPEPAQHKQENPPGEFRYFCHGLRISSDWRFPGVPTREPSDVDVRIYRQDLSHLFPDVSETQVQTISPEETHLALQGRGRFIVREGREIAYDTPLPDSHMDFSITLAELVWPVLLYQRRLSIFHAVCVGIGEREAFGLLGPPRAGKTALACALHARGAAVWDDDLLVFDSHHVPLEALRGFPLIKTQFDPASFSMCAGERIAIHSTQWKKALFRSDPTGNGTQSLPLTELFIVKPQEQSATLRLLKPSIALAELSPRWYGQLYAPLSKALGGLSQAFRESCALADRVPIYELGIPRTPDGLTETLDVLRQAGFLKTP